MVGRWFFTLAPLVLLIWLAESAQHGVWDTMRAVGCAALVASLVMNFVARLHLGGSFSITPQARQLVTGGIYSVVRHPIYVSGMAALAGFALYLHRPVYVIGVVILGALQYRRSQAEDRVLEEKFGQEYRDYRSNTWF